MIWRMLFVFALVSLLAPSLLSQDRMDRGCVFKPAAPNKVTVMWIANYVPPPAPGLEPIPLLVLARDEDKETTMFYALVQYTDNDDRLRWAWGAEDKKPDGWTPIAVAVKNLKEVKKVTVRVLIATAEVERTSPMYWVP